MKHGQQKMEVLWNSTRWSKVGGGGTEVAGQIGDVWVWAGGEWRSMLGPRRNMDGRGWWGTELYPLVEGVKMRQWSQTLSLCVFGGGGEGRGK